MEEIGGGLRLLERIGSGGFGDVYRARDTALERDVAVKVLQASSGDRAQRLNRLRREAKALGQARHPHIVAVHQVIEAPGGDLCLVMELLTGAPLHRLMADGPLDSERVRSMGAQLADALQAAHSAGIVHRDLTPRNVFVTPNVGAATDFVTILDFGLAQTDGHYSSSRDGAGTLTYMSPEQLLGEPADHRSDLYSLGLILYEMLAGSSPFGGQSSPLKQVATAVNEPPAPLSITAPNTPAEVAALIHQLLEKDADLRPQSGAEVRSRLLGEWSGPTPRPNTPDATPFGTTAPGQSASAPPPRNPKMKRTVLFVGAGAVSLGLALLAWTPPGAEGPLTSEKPARPAKTASPGVPSLVSSLPRRIDRESTGAVRRGLENSTSVVTLRSQPDGATVWIDGQRVGKTPFVASVGATYRLTMGGRVSRTVLAAPNSDPVELVRVPRKRHIPATP